MREERGWSQKYAFEQFHEELGLKRDSRASYDRLERGPRPPTPDQQKALIKFYGKSPDDLPDIVERPEPKDELVEALNKQAEAISLLASKLDALAGRLDEGWTDLAEAIGDLARASREAALGGSLRDAPDANGG